MKLLLDQNISRKLVDQLEKFFPGTTHIGVLGMETASDEMVWNHARENEFVLVTQDSDFSDRAVLFGHPPKVIWLRLGNVSTGHMMEVLQSHRLSINAFYKDDARGCLVIQ